MKAIAIFYIVLLLAAIGGWIHNLIDVVNIAQADHTVTAMFIVRIVGIFVAPLGAILGYC